MTPKNAVLSDDVRGCDNRPLPSRSFFLLSRQLWALREWSRHHHSSWTAVFDTRHRDVVGRRGLASAPETNRRAPNPPRAGRAGLRRSSVDVRSRELGRREFPGSEHRGHQDRVTFGSALEDLRQESEQVRLDSQVRLPVAADRHTDSTHDDLTPASSPVSGSTIRPSSSTWMSPRPYTCTGRECRQHTCKRWSLNPTWRSCSFLLPRGS